MNSLCCSLNHQHFAILLILHDVGVGQKREESSLHLSVGCENWRRMCRSEMVGVCLDLSVGTQSI